MTVVLKGFYIIFTLKGIHMTAVPKGIYKVVVQKGVSEAELSEFEQRMALITKTYGTAGAIMEQCAVELPDLPVQVDDLLQV